jgi:predicted O-methyltransferase YrrM
MLKIIKSTIKAIIIAVMTFLARIMAVMHNAANLDIGKVHSIFYERGFHFLRRSYYLPIPEAEDLGYQAQTALVGIDMNDKAQLAFLDEVPMKYKEEFDSFPLYETDDPRRFHVINSSFMAGDGNVYYSLIRHIKPRNIIEVGSGASTILAAHALQKNKEDDPGYSCKLAAIEPYPNKTLLNGFDGLSELKEVKVQEAGLDYFDQLSENDILFIDSSHALRSGGDVWWEYCEILPRLNSGVYVHVHDISLPKPYPQIYYDSYNYWNEQYMLQAYLTGNTTCEVVWAGTYMYEKYRGETTAAFSPALEKMRESFPLAEPSSFWFRVK